MLVVTIVCASSAAGAQALTVFAAASLRNALDEATVKWKSASRTAVVAYGASSALARQIENGAPAQVFISADLDWMDYLEQRSLIRKDSRRNILANSLVLVGPSDRTGPVEIKPGFPIAALLGNGRLAMADPHGVPAGKYARAALEKLGVWSSVSGRIAPAENVRAALALVARGEAPLGIVYASDAIAETKVRVAATFDAGLHPPITYPAALVTTARHPLAAEFLAFLSGVPARAIFAKHGFRPLN